MHDILSPKAKRKIDSTVKEIVKDLSVVSRKKRTVHKKIVQESIVKKEKSFPLKEIVIGGAVVVLLLAWYGITKLPKADIQIWPKIDTLTLSQKITADKSVTVIDISRGIIPATYVQEIKDGKQEFLATGSASDDGKATGSIIIYNKNNSVFTLVKGTHFLSDSGKYFVTLARISIPAMSKKTPGSALAQVQAKEAGESYNIGSSKFSAPKLYGTEYYYSIYAQSDSNMSGGQTGEVKKVTADDIKEAKNSLTKKILQEAKDSLRARLLADEVLLEGAIQNTVVSDSADVAAGTIVDKFNESVSVKISALVVKKHDLEVVVKDNIVSELPKVNNFIENSLDIKPILTSVDFKAGKMILDTSSSVKTYYNINNNELIDLFPAKSGDQIKQVIDQLHEGQISELKINFWPFWVHRAPDNKNRIKINLNF